MGDGSAREATFTALHDATRELMAASDRATACRIAVETARDTLDLPVSGIHLLDDDREALVPVETTDGVAELLGEAPAYEESDSLIWEVYRSGTARVVDDVDDLRDRLPDPDTPVGSGIVVPLGDHGVFITSARERRAFDDADVTFVRLLAAAAETALDRLRHEERLEALHAATRELMAADSPEAICAVAVETARDTLDMPINGCWLYDAADECLRPVAVTDRARALLGEAPTYEPGNSLSWRAFVDGETRVYDDVRGVQGAHNPDAEIRSEIILPLGEHGVMNIGSTIPARFDEADCTLARVLAANTRAALDRKEREAALERQNDRLEAFASAVSHDLRNPLGTARGYVGLAREEDDPSFLDPAEVALDRMERLIDDVLLLAREGRVIDETAPVSVAAVAEDAWRFVDDAAATLTVADDPGTIEADPERLQALFANLFRNAVEHAGEGVTVTVGPLDGGFYVADDGPGIPPEEREQVFESGYSSGGGTGLGLGIVERIAEAHGWTVAIRESEAGGARFEVTVA